MGHDYKGFYGKWSWNYDWAVHVDPTYRKFVTDIYSIIKPCLYEDDTFNPDVDIDPLRRDDNTIMNGIGDHISKDKLSETDMEVLSLMTDNTKSAAPVAQPVANNAIAAQNVVDYGYANDYDARTKERVERHEHIRSRSKYRNTYVEGREHEAVRGMVPPIPTVPLLPPPKVALASGSTFRMGPQYVYTMGEHEFLDDKSIVKAQAVSEDDTHIRLYTFQFILDRVYDSSKRSNRSKSRLVFNKKTGNMYIITYDKLSKRGKRVRKIMGVSTQVGYLGICMCYFEPDHVVQFVQKLKKATEDKIGAEATIVHDTSGADYSGHARNIIGLLWQHKQNKQLPWLSNELFDSIETLKSSLMRADDEFAESMRKRSLTKMMRKKAHPTTVFKYFLGDLFNNTVYKLVTHPSSINMYSIINFIQHMAKDKFLHHFISHVLNSKNHSFINRMLIVLAGASTDVIGYGHTINDMIDEDKLRLFNKYLRVLQSFCEKEGDDARGIEWHTFRDTFEMAGRFNISINLAQLNTARDIRDLHDRFSDYTQRDNSILRNLKSNVFMPFDHPDKEFSGFEFKFLGTAEDLVEEGREMKHCVGGYGYRCAEGSSLIFSMRKDDVSYITIEIDGKDFNCPVTQLYTRHDINVTNEEILKIVESWKQELKRMHSNDEFCYRDLVKLTMMYVSNANLLKTNDHPADILSSLLKEREDLTTALEKLELLHYAQELVKKYAADNSEDYGEPIDDYIPELNVFDIADTVAAQAAGLVPANG